ncbi:hypothetical protein B0H19DRAFT_1245245 [Mycena capillaripes]|nr:hypothetical protein B0H19DRAFT_1245245 [Mycena capillaripes]
MSSSANAPTPIQSAHAILPVDEVCFSILVPSSKDFRSIQSHIVQAVCSTCMIGEKDLGQKLRKCGKCHTLWYCSKECQTQNWPDHKPTCGESCIPKLIRTLISNEVLQDILHVCCILDFNLLHRSMFDGPLVARVNVAIEPSDILDFAEIFAGKGAGQEETAQLDNLMRHREFWRRERDRVDAKGFRTDPLALMDIAFGQNSIAVPVHIRSLTMKTLKQQILAGFNPISVVMGGAATVPFSVETCMEFMNTHIRADKKNQLLLRTDMRLSDIQVIRDVAANSDSVPAMILNDKLAREKIYQGMYQELLKRRKAACQEVGR